jgi:hypothetical protein
MLLYWRENNDYYEKDLSGKRVLFWSKQPCPILLYIYPHKAFYKYSKMDHISHWMQ